jgi:DNA-binding XRE family transcriptional regulator
MAMLAVVRKRSCVSYQSFGTRTKLQPATSGIGYQVRRAREAKGLTWYAVAKAAGIPNQNTVRDIEFGRDVNLSNLQAVAAVLGLRVELVASPSEHP